MTTAANTRLSDTFRKHQGDLLNEWLREQQAATSRRSDLITDSELRQHSATFLRLLSEAIASTSGPDVDGPIWGPVRELLSEVSRSRGLQGFSPSETAMFVFSLKQPVYARLRKELSGEELADVTWVLTVMLDRLGLYTTEVYQRSREEVIVRQQQEMMELSTPVVQLWEGVLALPLIGTLDSGRTQTVMETLLQRIVETEAETAIIDITGVPTVDTLTAQHLLKTVTATRLMGAECIISGIRPQIAQTIVQLGVNLGDVLTRSSMAAALGLALKRQGLTVIRGGARASGSGTTAGVAGVAEASPRLSRANGLDG